MSNNFYSVDFLNINKSKKLYAWVHGLILGVFILNSTMAGVFMIAPPALACHADITINKVLLNADLEDYDIDFDFTGDLGIFDLKGDESELLYKSAGTYTVYETEKSGWTLNEIECTWLGVGDFKATTTVVDNSVIIEHSGGNGTVECTFYNEKKEDNGKDDCKEYYNSDDYFTVAKWDWNGSAYYNTYEESGYDTSATGTAVTAYWMSNPGVAAVVRKAGNEPLGVFDGGTSGTVTKDSHDISHISLCGGPPSTGTITIVKDSLPDDSQVFSFNGDLDIFTLADDGTSASSQTFNDLSVGSYTVNEDTESGWDLNNITCTGGSYSPSSATGVLIDLDADEHITCTFINEKQPEDSPGELIVIKEVIGGDATSSEWTMYINDDLHEFPGSESGTAIELDSGMYQVTESAGPDNYFLTYDTVNSDCGATGLVSVPSGETKTCILINTYSPTPPGELIVIKEVIGGDATSSEWTMEIVGVDTFPGSLEGTARQVVGGHMYQVSESGGPSNYTLTYDIVNSDCGDTGLVSVPSGETKTCILINTYSPTPLGSIKVCKYEDEDGLASTTDDRALIIDTAWTFTIGSDSQDTVDGCITFNNLEAGEYTIIETQKSNWTPVDPANGELTVSLAVEEHKIVDFANTYVEPPAPYCGDGHLDEGEQCDDGNNVSGDGCSATCTTEGGGGGGGGGGIIYLQILDLDAYCLTADSAVVNWRTNKTATSWVVYGIDSDDIADATSTEVTSASTNHSIIIYGLEPGIDYSFEAVSRQGSREVKKTITYNTNACVITEGEEGEPVLTIVKSIDQEFVNPGDTGLEYTVIVTNIGNLTSFDTVLVDALPTGLTFSDNGENTKIWELGDMIPNESKEITYLVDVALDAAPMAYINTAKVSSSNHEEISDIADVDIRTVEVLAITGFDLSELISLVMVITMLFGMGWFVRQGLREDRR